MGVSSGGVTALKLLLGQLPKDFPVPVVLVQHISPDADDGLARLLNQLCLVRVKEADEEELIEAGTVYIAPPNYHLLLEKGGFLSFSADSRVSYARPSVDVLFLSAAQAFGEGVVGVILTGANFDGSAGLKAIKAHGGIAVVQDPADAQAPQMPQAALAAVNADFVLPLAAIAPLLCELVSGRQVTSQELINGERDV